MGPPLAAHLEESEHAALAELGALRPCAAGWAFALGERSLVPTLERALASLMPTAAQAHAAKREWYAVPRE